MSAHRRIAVGATVLIFVLVQFGAIVLVKPFRAAEYQVVGTPGDPTTVLFYLGGIAVATGVMLAAFRFGADRLVRFLIIGSSLFLSLYVFSVFLALLPATGLAILFAFALVVYPEWYVIDTVGIVIGMGAAGLFAVSLGLLPALLLLVILAVYDAISVYETEHMLRLASGVMDLKIPVVLVIPLTLSYSYLEESPPSLSNDEEENAHNDDDRDADRDAFFIGLGDVVMPSVLVASSVMYLPVGSLSTTVPITVPALTAMLGTLVGLGVLLRMVMSGRAHAGLPLLNGGAIVGYLIGALMSGVSIIRALGLAAYV